MMPETRVFSGHQPNFLPYMGFFYKMLRSDVFVLDDDVKFSRSGLHNANFIKVNGDKCRITIPVRYENGAAIKDVKICYDKPWADKMLKTFRMSYGKAKHFDSTFPLIENRIEQHFEYLADLNVALIRDIAKELGLRCDIVIASNAVPTDLTKNERNVYQCNALGCNMYYSGVGGKAYNDEAMYRENSIELVYSDYTPPRYRQVGKGFIENLSVIDYIFNQGFVLPEDWGDTNAKE